MAPNNLPPAFNATAQDVEMLLAAQSHIGAKNAQVHMEPYVWKTRQDGVNVINIGKTWYVCTRRLRCDNARERWRFGEIGDIEQTLTEFALQGEDRSCCPYLGRHRQPS